MSPQSIGWDRQPATHGTSNAPFQIAGVGKIPVEDLRIDDTDFVGQLDILHVKPIPPSGQKINKPYEERSLLKPGFTLLFRFQVIIT